MITVQKAHGVEFYSDENPGPLGKPTAQKITDDIEVRSWDPTDPDSKNPWKNYSGPSSSTSSSPNTNSSTSTSKSTNTSANTTVTRNNETD